MNETNECIGFSAHGRMPAEHRSMKSDDYTNLYFMVKRFYDASMKIMAEEKNTVPEYPKLVDFFDLSKDE